MYGGFDTTKHLISHISLTFDAVKTTAMKIPFNKPHFTNNEIKHIIQAAMTGQISGNGHFTRKCHRFLEKKFGFGKAFLTSSCTDALEMAAVLLDLKPGDEVICPSYTFVSTAGSFVLHGAAIRFADSRPEHPNVDASKIEGLITPRTRAIIAMHYGGMACDMDRITDIASRHNLIVIEDAALAIDAYYKRRALGSIGHLAGFSYHETKNLITGEGGMLAVNDSALEERAEIIWEKGTNRAAFKRGDVRKYEWVDVGSSYLPSEITAAGLYAQLGSLEDIQKRRVQIWHHYYAQLRSLDEKGFIHLPVIPEHATINGSMFFFTVDNRKQRDELLSYLNKQGIQAVFHYLPLHISPFYKKRHDGRELPNAVRFSETIVRLPFYYDLTLSDVEHVAGKVREFFL